MSVATWKKEYMPVSSSRCLKRNDLSWSIRKWTGFLVKNLERHKVWWDKGNMEIRDTSASGVRSHTLKSLSVGHCPLCRFYIASAGCHGCPLVLYGGCTYQYTNRFTDGAYPMVRLLRKAERLLG